MIEFERTKKLAKKNKMTLLEVNDRAGLGTKSIYNWKTRKPGTMALSAVANVLHTSIDYLSGTTDDPSPHLQKTVSLDQEIPYSYHGYHVPEKYLNMVRNLMEEDIKERQAQKYDGNDK
ncbi:transcriptional regulator with XRE-family HTH domain [Lactobacillus colini]|uniref:Transcriptional regulator with XRE-family HTH domain n=1 Tax=Lactobacillus colini TaxID=1819254 RepID=A0ABS4MG89_9LACO|nr:helix-turn-helix transcriptional regulator [Lactobacillus colini]MBP2058336.1 transcriptional regulator with XRE-family HTH domain [Lactobacillus colini]